MSIVKLKKITLYGRIEEKSSILEELQEMGCLHIIPLVTQENLLEKGNLLTELQEALKYLYNAPQKLTQLENDPQFNPEKLQKDVMQNKREMEEQLDERDLLKSQIKELEPWGNFTLPPEQKIGSFTLWFYQIPYKEMKNFNTPYWKLVGKDNLFSYVVVLAEEDPANYMVGKQIKVPSESLEELKKRLQEVEIALEDLQMQRVRFTRWLHLFQQNYFMLADQALLHIVSKKTYDPDVIFVLQAWIPAKDEERVVKYAEEHGLAAVIENASPEEQPPSLLVNKPLFQGGEDLISFYMTPNYRLWDPSVTVFLSFSVFFAMILSDAGYAVILAAILAFVWNKMGKSSGGRKFRIVLLSLCLFSVAWGMLVGSYFGITPSEGHFLGKLRILDMNNYSAMMVLVIMVGALHIVIANLSQAWSQRHSLTAVSSVGWAVALIGAVTTFIGYQFIPPLKSPGYVLIVIGLLGVLFFTSIERPFWKRMLMGTMGLTRITGMFGDVLSYLRLYALGLASSSLAVVFNDLAKSVYVALPGFKILVALLIILIGHGLNFALCMMSGFIHGLRLNYIEFFNWGLPEEGTPFNPFEKKDSRR